MAAVFSRVALAIARQQAGPLAGLEPAFKAGCRLGAQLLVLPAAVCEEARLGELAALAARHRLWTAAGLWSSEASPGRSPEAAVVLTPDGEVAGMRRMQRMASSSWSWRAVPVFPLPEARVALALGAEIFAPGVERLRKAAVDVVVNLVGWLPEEPSQVASWMQRAREVARGTGAVVVGCSRPGAGVGEGVAFAYSPQPGRCIRPVATVGHPVAVVAVET